MKIFFRNSVSFITCLLFVNILSVRAQQATVYPTHWWTGMKYNKVQLLLHTDADHIFPDKMALSIYHPGVKVGKLTRFKNKRYLGVDIEIAATTKPGKTAININTIVLGEGFTIPFEIKPRRKGNGTLYAQGLTSADVQYLIMPDRFSNGDPSNDKIAGMLDQTLRRDTVFNRHGGDLKGIQNHLDYLKDLGVTALWLNPVLENDMPNRTEHGYAFTDHYKIDRRIGGEKAYQQLIDAAHGKQLKVIQDAVYNHIGSEHVLFKDMPDSSWFHWWPKYTNTTYKEQTIFDPYASIIDKKQMTDGWFVPSMPDWNHDNKNVEKFLIQHALWTVEEFGIDAWRIDTYAYNDVEFMNRCNKALIDEYPKIFMFGETWVHGVPNQSYFTANNYNIPYKSNLHGVTDFQTLWGIKDAMTKDFGWTDGVNKLYTILAQDFVYKNAANNVVFLDNHDINRFYSEIGEDKAKYEMSLGWLLTTRGIPQLYYGNEIGMTGFTSPNDGYVRQDFPGGWEGDANNKFTQNGRNEKENAIFNFIKTLANYRKNSKALTIGKFTQYVPVEAVYVYFREYKNETIMVVINTGKEKKEFNLDRFNQQLQGKKIMQNIMTGSQATLTQTLSTEPQSILIAAIK
jgi:neopullulanase